MLHDSYAGPGCSDPFLQLRSLPSDCPFARRRAPILRLLFPDSAAVTTVYRRAGSARCRVQMAQQLGTTPYDGSDAAVIGPSLRAGAACGKL